ncbi:MAG TPA: PRC-barrel domain-containing protein [Usitatibacter sp.]|nr:PRC-barrel domain-containing protein [Usitatibacter sp.]
MKNPIAAADALGCPVVDANGTEVGSIEDLMIDTQRGAIAYVMMATTSERGDALVAVPWHALSHDAERQRFVIDEAALRYP